MARIGDGNDVAEGDLGAVGHGVARLVRDGDYQTPTLSKDAIAVNKPAYSRGMGGLAPYTTTAYSYLNIALIGRRLVVKAGRVHLLGKGQARGTEARILQKAAVARIGDGNDVAEGDLGAVASPCRRCAR